MQKSSFVYVTFIRSTPQKVFEALTDPAITKKYWGHENVSDWKPGSKWEHVRDNADHNVNITGNVIECTPPSRLVVSWSSPDSYADTQKHSRVTYEITEYEGMVKLAVHHDELEKGGSMEQGISRGWPIVLSSLKSWLETGEAIDIFAKPKAA